MYSREEIEKVRSAVDIVEVVREYVPSLHVAGRTAKGLCPFHNEKTASFHLQPEKGFFKCFGCGEAGDVIAFISKMEQVPFTEALERLAAQAGIVLKQERVSKDRQEPEGFKEKLWRVLEAAKNFYISQLQGEKSGEIARGYLSEREIREEFVREFQIGFSPVTGETVIEALVRKNFSIEMCQQAGLAVRSAAGRYYDPLFGRLIFPIFDSFGHTVGFGGRLLPNLRRNIPGLTDVEKDDAPKYINSPETPVFSKGKLLYGLSQAKSAVLGSRRVVLLEGYMDVVGLHQGGFKAAVATLGTALTRDHAKLLKRYADEAVAFFDPDEAGRAATVRGLEPLLQETIFPRVVLTTETKDPDEILLEKGPDFFEDLLKNAPDGIDYLMGTSGVTKQSSLDRKTKLAGELLAVIGQSPNEILRSEWIFKVASTLGLQVDALMQELRRKGTPKQGPSRQAPDKLVRRSTFPSVEEEYLHLLFVLGTQGISAELQQEDFSEDKHRKLFQLLKAQIEEKGTASLPAVFDGITETDQEWASRLLMEEKTDLDPVETKERLIRNIKTNRAQERLAVLSEQLKTGRGDRKTQDEFNFLLKRLKGSKFSESVIPVTTTKVGI